MEDKHLVPLSKLEAGQTARVVNIDAGQGLKSRLTAMGLVPNTKVTVVRVGRPGPYVIRVKNSRIMLGRGMAHKIIVSL